MRKLKQANVALRQWNRVTFGWWHLRIDSIETQLDKVKKNEPSKKNLSYRKFATRVG